MHTINIFLASPFDVKEWRTLIGDLIRQWSDMSEPKGYRLKLLCWEDFMPEFTGERKQTEYNEQLIRRCNIFIALFKSRCGKYTKEEIDFAKSIGLENIHFFVINDSSNNAELERYLQTENFHVEKITSFDKLAYHLGNTIQGYIDSLSKPKPKRSTDDVRNIYSTISTDWEDLAPEIGNAIRSLDYIVEEQMGMRARLLNKNKEKIDFCHYYMGFINSSLHKDAREEIHYAIDNTPNKGSLTHTILYFNDRDNYFKNDTDIYDLLRTKEIFSENYENSYKVKWNLLIWFLHEALTDVDTNCGLKFDSDWITFMGIPIIPIDDLDITFDKSWDENQKLIFLLAEINKRQLLQKCENLGDGSKPLDFETLSAQINSIEHNSILADKLKANSIELIKQLLSKIESRMEALKLSAENAGELYKLNKNRERLLGNMLTYDATVASELFSTKLFFISLYNSFSENLRLEDYNQDEQYLDIVNFADSHNLHSPVIEMQRMNYANYLLRNNIPDEALRYYEIAKQNLNKFNIHTPLFIQYSVALYLNYINSLIGLGLRDDAIIVIHEFEEKINSWNELRLINRLYDVYKVCLYSAKLRCGVIMNLNDGITLLKSISAKEFYKQVPKELYDDIYYLFPNILAAALIDTRTYDNTLAAIGILMDNYTRIKVETNLKLEEKLFHLGELTHNLALAYNRIHNPLMAIKFATEAITAREKLYRLKNQDDNLFHIAESKYILSIIYLYKRNTTVAELKQGIEMADKAIDLYSYLDKGYIEQQTCIYKAKLAKASIQLLLPEMFQEGKALMTKCYEWALTHPNSSYKDIIISEYELRFRG